MPSKLRSLMMYGMPALMIVATSWLPGALQLSFATATCWGVAQGQVLRRPAVREYLGISPIITPVVTSKKSEEDNGWGGLRMAPTYQPPRKAAEKVKPEATGMFAKAKEEVTGALDEAWEKMAQYSKTAAKDDKTSPAGKSKAFLTAAQQYEKRKQAELRLHRKDRE